MPQEEIDRLLVEHARAGQARGAAQGRRPVRVRPRRRGGAACCARPGSPFEVVPGHHRRASPRPPTPASRSPTASSPAASRSSPATRTPTSPSRRSTGPRSPRFPGTLVFYMGVRALPRIAERLIAERPPADEPVAVVERGTLPGQRTRRRHARRRRRARAGGRHPRAGDHARRRRRRAARASSRGSSAARCTAARSRSRARARRRARSPRGCATLGADVIEAPAIRIAAAARPSCPTSAATTCSCVTTPERRARAAARRACATPATLAGLRVAAIGPGHRARAARARHRAGHRARARRRRGAGRGARGRAGRSAC